MRVRHAAVGVVALALVGGCGGGRTPQTICPPADRKPLLDARLQPLTPSTAFTVERGDLVWIQATRVPSTYDQSQLFGRTGIEVHLVRDGAAPNMATDPSVVMRGPLTWTAVGIGAGLWRAYALRDPTVEIVACGK